MARACRESSACVTESGTCQRNPSMKHTMTTERCGSAKPNGVTIEKRARTERQHDLQFQRPQWIDRRPQQTSVVELRCPAHRIRLMSANSRRWGRRPSRRAKDDTVDELSGAMIQASGSSSWPSITILNSILPSNNTDCHKSRQGNRKRTIQKKGHHWNDERV